MEEYQISSEIQSLETKLNNSLIYVEPPEKNDFHKQCIYRVPKKIRETNLKAYTPQIITIGPFYEKYDIDKKENTLEPIGKLKLKYLKGFLNRTKFPLKDFIVKLKELEERIRSSYAEPIKYNSYDLLDMILVDACFIIEFILRCNKYIDWAGKDPLFIKPSSILTEMQLDLILIENQLPFFVLEELYNLTDLRREFPPFLEISCNLFKSFVFGTSYLRVDLRESPKHFTDLLRSLVVPSSRFHLGNLGEYKEIKYVYSASQLKEAGLKFKVNPNANLLGGMTYSKGVLTMPILNIYDGTETLFRNIMAYEECDFRSAKIIIQYVAILDFLINNKKDVNVLVDEKIIINWTGDANKVVKMINNLSSYFSMPHFHPHYVSLCNELNGFYENPLNKYKAIFIHEYFNTPWKIASTTAAVVLLLLTFIQTVCSMISAIHGE